MVEIDNCPVCDTKCELEIVGNEGATETTCATCKTCRTRWRRRDDPKNHSRLIYEKWTCRIPAMNIPFPFVGGGIKLGPKWCRWAKITERRISADHEIEHGLEEKRASRMKTFDETISIKARDASYYKFKLSKNGKVKGEVSSEFPINVLFMDERNFDKFDRIKSYETGDETEGVYEAKIDFEARKKDIWFVVIENQNKTPTKVKIHIYTV